MFRLWIDRLQVCGLFLYNYAWLYPVSTVLWFTKALTDSLYKLSTQSLPSIIHYDFSNLTGVFGVLYPQSTEPITTTTLI